MIFDLTPDGGRAGRSIRARKFYATLPNKLDKAEKEYLDQVTEEEPTSEFTEELDGETLLGGMMRRKRIDI